jgi:hypothetical protein
VLAHDCLDRVGLRDVALLKVQPIATLRPRAEPFHGLDVPTKQVVHHDDVVPVGEQSLHGVRPDIAGPAGHKHVHALALFTAHPPHFFVSRVA